MNIWTMAKRLAFLLAVVALLGCSLANREGPDVTCVDLQSGAENACADGIVATCQAGAVRWLACDDATACKAPWQTVGRYRCAESDPIPVLLRLDGGAPGGAGSGSGVPSGTGGGAGAGTTTGGAGSGSAAGGTSGDPGDLGIGVCGACPTSYTRIAQAINDNCGGCSCGLASPGDCAQSLCVRKGSEQQIVVSNSGSGCSLGREIKSVPDKCAPAGVKRLCLLE